MKLNKKELNYWNRYLATLTEKPEKPKVMASIAGHEGIADQLLFLYLSGKKTAGSGLVKDYKYNGEDLPEVGTFWIVLDRQKDPRCILKTIRVETCLFSQVTEEVAIAEGEGDLSLEHWREVHTDYFEEYLEEWKIENLDQEEVITEYFEVVYK